MQSPLDYLEVVLLNEVKDGPPHDTRTWWQFVEGEGEDVLKRTYLIRREEVP